MIPDFEVEAVRVIHYLASERTNLLGELSALTLELVECRRALALALATNPVADQAAMDAAQAATQEAVRRAEVAEADLAAANQRIQQLEQAVAAERQQEANAMDVLTPFLNEIDGLIPAAPVGSQPATPAPTPEPVAPEPVATEPVATEHVIEPKPEPVAPTPDPIPDFLAPEPTPEPTPEPVTTGPVIEEPAAETPVVEATDPVAEVVTEPVAADPLLDDDGPAVIGTDLPPLPVMPEGSFEATPEPVPVEPVATEPVAEVPAAEPESFDNSPADPNSSTVLSPEPAPAASDTAAVSPGNEPLIP